MREDNFQYDDMDDYILEANNYLHKKIDEGEQQDKQKGSLEKLVDVMSDKKDKESKNILKMAKGMLKSLKKNDGLSSEQAQWLFKMWSSMSANN